MPDEELKAGIIAIARLVFLSKNGISVRSPPFHPPFSVLALHRFGSVGPDWAYRRQLVRGSPSDLTGFGRRVMESRCVLHAAWVPHRGWRRRCL